MTGLQVQTDLTGKKHFLFSGEAKKGREFPQDSKQKKGLSLYGDDEK